MNRVNNIKTVILGEANIGKTSMTYRMTKNAFNDNMESTVGASFVILNYDNIRYEIWDTAGQERYLSLVPMYYRNSDLIILVFDVSNPDTMNRFKYYLDRIMVDVTTNYKILVVGNKCDLVNMANIKKVNENVKELLDKYNNIIGNFELIYVSAKTGFNFDEFINKIREYGSELQKEKLNSSIKYQDFIELTPKTESKLLGFNLNYCYC